MINLFEKKEPIYFESVIAITENENLILYVKPLESNDLEIQCEIDSCLEFISEGEYKLTDSDRNIPKEHGVYTCKIHIEFYESHTIDGCEYDAWFVLTDLVKINIPLWNE